jgi:hypothetical protein
LIIINRSKKFIIVEIDIKVDEIEDLNAAIQERKNQKPSLTNRDLMGAPVLPPPSQSLFSFLDGVGVGVTPR